MGEDAPNRFQESRSPMQSRLGVIDVLRPIDSEWTESSRAGRAGDRFVRRKECQDLAAGGSCLCGGRKVSRRDQGRAEWDYPCQIARQFRAGRNVGIEHQAVRTKFTASRFWIRRRTVVSLKARQIERAD